MPKTMSELEMNQELTKAIEETIRGKATNKKRPVGRKEKHRRFYRNLALKLSKLVDDLDDFAAREDDQRLLTLRLQLLLGTTCGTARELMDRKPAKKYRY